ncbi:hypothetical protein LINGRAHAP2_LOCUS31830 [Linum grandiflorum]
MYGHTCEDFSKLLKDLRLMKRSSHGGTNNDVSDSNHEQDDPIVGGVKSKPTVGWPKGRLKGPLERRKNQKAPPKSKVLDNTIFCAIFTHIPHSFAWCLMPRT